MTDPKDVVLAILGASGALAGLLLVFSGFIFSQASSFPATTDDTIIARYTKAARLGIYPFLGFLGTTLLCVAWLLHPDGRVFAFCVALFVLLVIGTGVYGLLAAYRYL
jgi:hypothetical protein